VSPRPVLFFFYQAMSEQAMTSKTRTRRATLRPGSLVSKATAARLLDCDHATIRRRVADGLPVVQTVGGERLTVRSLFPGLTDSAVEQLMRGIVMFVVLAGCQMGCAAGEKLLLAGRLGSNPSRITISSWMPHLQPSTSRKMPLRHSMQRLVP